MNERLSDESMRITSALLSDVRRDLARGCDPEGEEPDEHKAVRTIESECVRARDAEAAEKARADALEADCAAFMKVMARVQRIPLMPSLGSVPYAAVERVCASDAGKRLLEEHAVKVAQLESSNRLASEQLDRMEAENLNLRANINGREAARVSMEAEFRAMEARWLQATMNAKKAEREHAAALAAKDARIVDLERTNRRLAMDVVPKGACGAVLLRPGGNAKCDRTTDHPGPCMSWPEIESQ